MNGDSVTVTLGIMLAPLALATVAHAARVARGRAGRGRDPRLEAMDERRAAANLYGPERRIQAAQRRPPTP